MHDVTSSAGRHQPPATLPAALGLLDAIMKTSDDAILSLDAAGRVTRSNLAAERLFGHPPDGIPGLVCTDLFALHVRGDVAAALDTVMAGHPVQHLETEIQRADGMPVPISLSLSPVFDGPRHPAAALMVGRDITEQRVAQASLAEIEARVRESEALANVGSWLWDLRTSSVQWSDEFHHIHGVDPLDFDGTLDAHLAMVHPDDRDAVRAGMEESVRSSRAFDHEHRIVRADGEERTLHVRAQPMAGSDGLVVGLRGIGQDITDRGARPS